MLAVLAAGLGLATGLVAGGRIKGLLNVRLRAEVAIVGLFLLQSILRAREIRLFAPASYSLLGWVGAVLAIVFLLTLSIRTPGIALVVVGYALNLLVVLANHGMPILPTAVALLGGEGVEDALATGQYVTLDRVTLVPWLGDDMPLPLPLYGGLAVSPGDVLIAVGIIVLLVSHLTISGAPPIDEPDPTA